MNTNTNQNTTNQNTKAMIINAAELDMTRVVITSMKGRKHDVVHFDIDSNHQRERQTMSNIYKAVVTSVELSLNAVFVNFGGDRHGFLPLSNISSEYFLETPTSKGNPKPEDLGRLIKVGQELVVQVEKEERGNKGAALTTFISLAGSYVVLMPNNDRGGGVSRQIEGAEREALKNKVSALEIPEGMSLIVRTAGVGRSLDDLKWDLSILLRYWDAIKKAAIAKPGPYLIVEESDIVLRSVRDHFRQDIDEVVIDEAAAYERVRNYINLVRPDFLDRIKRYDSSTPIFSHYQVETQVSTAFDREVRLRSGASIVIDQTEALVAIDVNSARATKGANIEETAFQTNLQATDEIARQIRFRDLSGLVVIDYIDMVEPSHRRTVEDRLAEAMSIDRARVQRTRISELGLLELSRQRLRRTLTRLTNITCPRCDGQGLIRTVESLANSIIHMMQDNQTKSSNPLHFTLQCPLDLTTFLMNEKRADIQKLTDLHQTKVTIIPNQHMLTPAYQLKQTELNVEKDGQQPTSYQQIKQNKTNTLLPQKKTSRASFNEPAINEYLSMPTEREQNPESGLLGRLAKRWFGNSDEQQNTSDTDKKSSGDSKTQDRTRRPQRPSRQQGNRGGERPPRRQGESQQQRRRSDSPRRDDLNTEGEESSSTRQQNTGTHSASNSSNTMRATPKAADAAKRTSTRRGSRGGSRSAVSPEESTTNSTRPTTSIQKEQTAAPAPNRPVEKPAPAPVKAVAKPPADVAPAAPAAPVKKSLSSARRTPGARQARPMPKKIEKKAEDTEKLTEIPTAPATPPKRYKKTPSSARQVSKRPGPKKAVKTEDKTEKGSETSE